MDFVLKSLRMLLLHPSMYGLPTPEGSSDPQYREEPPPPPPPVLEMPATFNLELSPGHIIGLETNCSSDDLDMSRTDDGTMVAGMFWGKLEIIHDGDTHTMEFTGTRKDETLPNEFFFDQRVMTKLAVAAKPTTARCHIYMASPEMQYVDIVLSLHSLWKFGATWPLVEPLGDHKVKFFVRVHPGGALEDITNQAVVSSLYYEAMYVPIFLLLVVSDVVTGRIPLPLTRHLIYLHTMDSLCPLVTSSHTSPGSSTRSAYPYKHAPISSVTTS
jgi:hypothetical protein